MTDEEAREYLKQHWQLYLSQEIAAAYSRCAKRMEPHLIEIAQKNTADKLADTMLAAFGCMFQPDTTKPAEAGSEGQPGA